MTDVFDTLIARAGSSTARRRTLRLLVDGVVQNTSMPSEGRYVLGRGADVHVHVSHPTVSRRHAELVITAEAMTLVDLASANGTRIGARELAANESVSLELGELFSIGNVLVVVVEQALDARMARSVGRSDIAAAIARAASFHRAEGPFSLATFRFADAARHLEAIAVLLPTPGHVAAISDEAVVVLLSPIAPASAKVWFESLAGYFTRAGYSATIEIKSCPDDGETLARLLPDPAAAAALPAGATGSASAPSTRTGEVSAVSSRAGLGPSSHASVSSIASPAMRKVYDLVDRVAATPTTILILGETGVGKEVLARAVHDRSDRARAPFVALNCAALHETLLESELFGYEKGAFTGAQAAKTGLIEAANGGTLFLDELGEMPLSTQAKLLRVLEERTVLPVGGVKPRPVDVRLVAATNRELLKEVESKRFRADLYYRLNSIILRLPPLRERKEEIAPLSRFFAEKAARALRRTVPTIPPEVVAALEAFPWPGNVRELRNAVERLVLLARGDVVSLEHLPDELRIRVGLGTVPPPGAAPGGGVGRVTLVAYEEMTGVDQARLASAVATQFGDTQQFTLPPNAVGAGSLDDEVGRLERAKISEALEKCAGNQTRAAEMLGLTRRVLVGKMDKYNLPRPRR